MKAYINILFNPATGQFLTSDRLFKAPGCAQAGMNPLEGCDLVATVPVEFDENMRVSQFPHTLPAYTDDPNVPPTAFEPTINVNTGKPVDRVPLAVAVAEREGI